MSVTIHIDFSNGTTKTIANVEPGTNMSVTGALDAAQLLQPGLSFEFQTEFVDRGGRDVGAVTAIDGVAAGEGRVWGIWVNGRTASDLRRVVPGSVSNLGFSPVADGDVIACKLMDDEA